MVKISIILIIHTAPVKQIINARRDVELSDQHSTSLRFGILKLNNNDRKDQETLCELQIIFFQSILRIFYIICTKR